MDIAGSSGTENGGYVWFGVGNGMGIWMGVGGNWRCVICVCGVFVVMRKVGETRNSAWFSA